MMGLIDFWNTFILVAISLDANANRRHVHVFRKGKRHQHSLAQIGIERNGQQCVEIAEAELEYWKTHSVERFISSIQTSTRWSSTLKKNLRAFFSYYWKRTRVCSFSDLLSLTEDQYSTFANSWAHTSSLVGAKSFEFLKDQIIARGFKFSDEVVVSLVETPSETHYWQTHYYGFHIESIEEEV